MHDEGSDQDDDADDDQRGIMQPGGRSEQRVGFMPKVRLTYFYWELATLISIAIGMVTTILVSVSSTEFGRGDGADQRLIRVLAIIFPALGTATAAVISFYTPQVEWGQVSRTLASVVSRKFL